METLKVNQNRAHKSMDFRINDISFEYKQRVTTEFKVTYYHAEEYIDKFSFATPVSTWNYLVEYYYEGSNNNYLILEDEDCNYDLLTISDFIHDVLLSMFKAYPNLISGKDNVFSVFPLSETEWCVAVYDGIMKYRKDTEGISTFWHRIIEDEDILEAVKEYSFKIGA